MVDQAERDAHRQKLQELQRQLRAKERSKAPSSTDLRIKREALLRGVGAATSVQRPSASTRQPTYEQHRAAQLLAETAENEARRAAQREKQAKLREQKTLASGRARAAAREHWAGVGDDPELQEALAASMQDDAALCAALEASRLEHMAGEQALLEALRLSEARRRRRSFSRAWLPGCASTSSSATRPRWGATASPSSRWFRSWIRS